MTTLPLSSLVSTRAGLSGLRSLLPLLFLAKTLAGEVCGHSEFSVAFYCVTSLWDCRGLSQAGYLSCVATRAFLSSVVLWWDSAWKLEHTSRAMNTVYSSWWATTDTSVSVEISVFSDSEDWTKSGRNPKTSQRKRKAKYQVHCVDFACVSVEIFHLKTCVLEEVSFSDTCWEKSRPQF